MENKAVGRLTVVVVEVVNVVEVVLVVVVWQSAD